MAAAAGSGVFAVAPGAFLRGETFVERDLAGYYRPAKSLLVPLWTSSEGLPLWNPLFASGQPFGAKPEHEIFHPLRALFFVLPFEWAFRLQIVVPLLVASLSMWFLLGVLGVRTEARLLGGLVWSLGGYTLSTTNLLPILFAISVLPAVLAFAVRVLRKGGAGDVAGLGLSLGLECLAGEPSALLMTACLVPIALASEGFSSGARPSRRSFALVAAGLALGASLGAVTLVPGLHHASKTVRAAGLAEKDAGIWSFPPIRAVELVAPKVLGHVESADERWYWGRGSYPDRAYPFLYSVYPGLLTVLLAWVAARHDTRRHALWIGTAVTGFVLAIGTHAPVWRSVRSFVPGLSALRYPEKFILLTVLALTLLAAFGFDDLLRSRRDVHRALARSLTVIAAVAVAAGFSVLLLDASRAPTQWLRFGVAPGIARTWANVASFDAFRVAAGAVAGLGVLVLARRIAWPLVALTAADLVLAGRGLLPTRPAAALAAVPPFLAPLAGAKSAGALFHLAAWDPVLGTTSGIASPPVPVQWGIPLTLEADFDLTELRWSHQATEEFLGVTREEPGLLGPLLARRGAVAVLRFRPGLAGRVGEELAVGPEGPLQLLQVRDPRPFVFCASRVVSARGRSGWRDAVRRLGAQAATASVADPGDVGALPEAFSGCVVTPPVVRPGRVAVTVDAPGPEPAFVAVNQTWDDGWTGTIDGAAARVLRTDLSLTGLLVPPGRHRVSLVYRDPSVAAGLAVSLGALATTIVLVLVAARRRVVTPSS